MNKKNITLIVVALAIAGVSFYGGFLYGKSQTNNRFGQKQFGNMPGGMNPDGNGMRQGQNGGLVNGEIMSKDDKSITVKLRDGGSKIIFLNADTKVSKMADGSVEDLAQGVNVMISGSANQDGSVTAQTIQLRPAGQMMPAQNGQPGNNQPADKPQLQ